MYMSLGMCFGTGVGMLIGSIVFKTNIAIGMCFGMAIGLSLGLAIGSAKDERLSKKAMTVAKIESVENSTDMVIYATQQDGSEKQYKVTKNRIEQEKFKVGDTVAEETNGTLVSLES
jgi:hypothetical protein